MAGDAEPATTRPALAPSGGAAESGGVREVKSAARTVELLEFLAANRHQPIKLRDVAEGLGAPRSSAYALLRTLVERGWVRTDVTGSLYSIGIQALLAGTSYLDVDPVLRIVQPQIGNLSGQLNETIHYGRLQGSDVVYLATRESSQYQRSVNRVGRRLPAFATAMGKALLAEQLANAGEAGLVAHLPAVLTPLTQHTVTNPVELRRQLRQGHRNGFAVDHQENLLGVTCVAVALHLGASYPDALSCSLPLARLGKGRKAVIVQALSATKNTLEQMAPARGLYDSPGV